MLGGGKAGLTKGHTKEGEQADIAASYLILSFLIFLIIDNQYIEEKQCQLEGKPVLDGTTPRKGNQLR